jgi:hypothetical protein
VNSHSPSSGVGRGANRWAVLSASTLLVLGWLAVGGIDRDSARRPKPIEGRPHRPAPLWTGEKQEVDEEAHLEKARLDDATTRFLAERGGRAENLAFAYVITSNARYLDAALAADPNNVSALFAGVAVGPLERRAEWVQRLRQLEPENPLWYLEEALASLRRGEKEPAFAPLRTAVTLGGLHDPFPGFLAVEEAFRRDYLHRSFRESMTEAQSSRRLTLGCHFYSLHHHLATELEAARAAGLTAKVRELAALGLDLALLEARQRSLDRFRGGALQEDRLLRLIERDPSSAQILDRPLKQYRQEVITDVRFAGRLAQFRTEFIETASESELRQYVAARSVLGEAAALQSLVTTWDSRTEARDEREAQVDGSWVKDIPKG